MRLAACIVSYRSGGFALACAGSLLVEWERMGCEREELDLVVVDNGAGAGPEQDDAEPWVAALEELGALVVRSAWSWASRSRARRTTTSS